MHTQKQESDSLPAAKPRNPYIETVRGLAILMVTVGHVIGIDKLGGMKVPDCSVWRYFYSMFQHIQIPLFTAISGWVYAIKPIDRWGGRFIVNKARRIMIPMAVVGTMYYLLQYFTPGTNMKFPLNEIWKIYVLPYTLYWYLPSIFLVFCFIALADRHKLADDIKSWGILLLLTCIAPVIGNIMARHYPSIFSIWGAMSILPYFIVGVGINRFSEQLATPKLRRIYTGGFILIILLQQLPWLFPEIKGIIKTSYIYVLIGLVSSFFFLTVKWKNRGLEWLGKHSYPIYLFHAFGTAGGRRCLSAHIPAITAARPGHTANCRKGTLSVPVPRRNSTGEQKPRGGEAAEGIN